MKKYIIFALSLLMIVVLGGCGNRVSDNDVNTDIRSENIKNEEESETVETSENENTTPNNKSLIVYFSHSGNTEKIANMIANQTGADLFEVETATVYPTDIAECTDVAKEEQDNNVRPELITHVENMEQYDVIYLGYPNWWGTMPMAMYTFLEEYDFSGKTIIPFCTHLGSGLGRSEQDITSLCPNAELLEGIAVRGTDVDKAQENVEAWLDGFVEK